LIDSAKTTEVDIETMAAVLVVSIAPSPGNGNPSKHIFDLLKRLENRKEDELRVYV
jgi:hypothetical protein